MHTTPFFGSFALAAVVAAVPVTSVQPRDTDICKGPDTTNITDIQSFLSTQGPIIQLDLDILTFYQHETDWLKTYWNLYFSDIGGGFLMDGCSAIDGSCQLPPVTCRNMTNPLSYWILYSVLNLQSKANIINNLLLWDGWINSNTVAQITKDFTTTQITSAAYTWLSSAFTVAGSIASVAEVGDLGAAQDLAGGMFGIMSWGFGQAASSAPPSDSVDPTQVYSALTQLVAGVATHIKDMMQDVTGHGDPGQLPIYYNTGLNYQSAQFLSDPHILLDVTAENNTLTNTWTNFSSIVEDKLVNVAMQSAYYVLLGDKNTFYTQELCEAQENYYWGPARDGGDSYCWYFTAPTDSTQCSNNDPSTCKVNGFMTPDKRDAAAQFPSSIYSSLTSTYGFTLNEYYGALIDCKVNGNNEIDESATISWRGHTVPRCFFNMTVWEGSWSELDNQRGSAISQRLLWSADV